MDLRLYQLIAECDDWLHELSRLIAGSGDSPRSPGKRSSAWTLLLNSCYIQHAKNALEKVRDSIASSTSFDVDAVFSFLTGDTDAVDELLTAVGMALKHKLRPDRLREFCDSLLSGSISDTKNNLSSNANPYTGQIDTALAEFEELSEEGITRNNQELVAYLKPRPAMINAQALKRNRTRTLEILNSLGSHNRQRAYEIVGLLKGLSPEAIRRANRNSQSK
jgi:hypothetical protein